MRVRDDVDLGDLMYVENLKREYEDVCAQYNKALALGDLMAVAELGKKKKGIFKKIAKALKKVVSAPVKLVKKIVQVPVKLVKGVTKLVSGGKSKGSSSQETAVEVAPPPAPETYVTTQSPGTVPMVVDHSYGPAPLTPGESGGGPIPSYFRENEGAAEAPAEVPSEAPSETPAQEVPEKKPNGAKKPNGIKKPEAGGEFPVVPAIIGGVAVLGVTVYLLTKKKA